MVKTDDEHTVTGCRACPLVKTHDGHTVTGCRACPLVKTDDGHTVTGCRACPLVKNYDRQTGYKKTRSRITTAKKDKLQTDSNQTGRQ